MIVFALALGDAVVPILPSEAALITAGLLSVVGDLTLGWVIAAGALGAYCGDGISYALGRFAGRPFQERFLNGERAQRALAWSRGQLEERGGLLLVVARYVPGGRTAATFTCGVTRFPFPRFAAFDAAAALSWAVYGGARVLRRPFLPRQAGRRSSSPSGSPARLTLAVAGGRRCEP